MDQRFFVLAHLSHQRCHILQIAFCVYRFLQIIGCGKHTVLSLGVLKNLSLFHVVHISGIDMERHIFLVTQVAENRLVLGLGRIFTNCPNTAIGVAEDEMVGVELNGRRSYHIKEVFDVAFCMVDLYRDLLFLFCHCLSFLSRE